MKKNIVTLLLSAAVIATLVGCGSSDAGTAPAGVEKESITAAKEEPAKEAAAEEKSEAENVGETTSENTAPEGEVDVVLDEGIEKYEGSWHEEIAGRGSMEIGPMGDGKYYIEVNWGASASEMAAWRVTALYDYESGDLTYDDGSYQMITFDESGNETVTEEKSVHGVLHLNDEGKIEWTDSAYDSDEPSIFIK